MPALAVLLRDREAGQALHMITLTLTRMAEGGLFDQLGGGTVTRSMPAGRSRISRKCWRDNTQLLDLYAQAAMTTGEPLFAGVARRTADWLLRELGNGEGALYSSLDADSEGHEGQFYVWQRERVQQTLTAPEFGICVARFGLDLAPNFEGQWHLRIADSLEHIAATQRLSTGTGAHQHRQCLR